MSQPTPTDNRRGGNHRETNVAPPTLIAGSQGLDAFMEAASRTNVVSVDTESNSLFVYYPQVCLIQISLPDADYVIDPLAFDVTPLGDLFADPSCEKIFHAAENDILGLKRDFGFDFANIFDTMMAARILGWPQAGLAAILAEQFDVTLDKSLQRTNWGLRPLQRDQLAYAQLDTHYLLPLKNQQTEDLLRAERLAEAQENFARLETLEWVEKQFDPNGFWHLDGARTLSSRELAVLRELFLFREEQAQRENRPPFKIIDQQVLLTLTRQQPDNLAALRQIRGLSAPQIRFYGGGILDAIESGRVAPPPVPPRRPATNGRPDANTLTRYEALRNWRKETAQQRGVDPDIVLTNDQLMVIARYAPTSLDSLAATKIFGPWKLEAYGPAILRVLACA